MLKLPRKEIKDVGVVIYSRRYNMPGPKRLKVKKYKTAHKSAVSRSNSSARKSMKSMMKFKR